MFTPNNRGNLSTRIGSNKFGESQFSAVVSTPCAVVRLKADIKKTAIRTDASGSRGAADETVSIAIILFPSYVTIGLGDRFIIGGDTLRVMMVQPRYAISGKLDHYECDFEAWTDGA